MNMIMRQKLCKKYKFRKKKTKKTNKNVVQHKCFDSITVFSESTWKQEA